MGWTFGSNTSAQVISEKNWGAKLGVIVNFGTHINQVGLRLNVYGTCGFGQINAQNSTTFSLSHLANRKTMWENRFALGGLLLGGKKNSTPDFIWGALHHQTEYQNAIGYNYQWYKDNRNTSQKSGGWTVQFSDFQIYFENDIFGGFGRDKFRTGHLQLAYRFEDLVINTGVQLWTGETRGSRWEKTNIDKCPSGFRILEDLPYGKTSHGIFYVGMNHNLESGNFASARIGIDSEQVRHVFQNRISHDLIWLPKRVERHTPHYPRLDENGCPIFFKKDMRKNLFFRQLGINNTWAY